MLKISLPISTLPVATTSIESTSSIVVINTWVKRYGAFEATNLGSNLISSSPLDTSSPSFTIGENPSPFKFTVSIPMCKSTSIPSVAIVKAWLFLLTEVILPSQGEHNTSLVGSIEIPSPTIFCAKAGSGTFSNGNTTPLSGDPNTIFLLIIFS